MTAQNPRELSHQSAVTRMLLETKPNGFWLLWAELLRAHHHLVSMTQGRWSQGRDPAGTAQISALWFGVYAASSPQPFSAYSPEERSCLNPFSGAFRTFI